MVTAKRPHSGNTDLAWGAHRPPRLSSFLISLCHLLSNIRFLKHVSMWVRRPLKYSGAGPMDIELWGLKLRLFPQGNVSESRMLFTPGLFDKKERLYLKRFLTRGCIFLTLVPMRVDTASGYTVFWEMTAEYTPSNRTRSCKQCCDLISQRITPRPYN